MFFDFYELRLNVLTKSIKNSDKKACGDFGCFL